jgi:hypothetical protein
LRSDIVKSKKTQPTRRFINETQLFLSQRHKTHSFLIECETRQAGEMVKLSCMKYETLTLYIEIIVASIAQKTKSGTRWRTWKGSTMHATCVLHAGVCCGRCEERCVLLKGLQRINEVF